MRSKLWRSGLQFARRSRNWLMGWRCASRPGRSGRCSAQKPPMASRVADHGQTDQLSHVIVCLSGSSDLGPAARRAVGRGRVTGATSRSIKYNPSPTHCASRQRPPPILCRPGRRAGLGWIDTIGPRIGVSRISACRGPLFGGLNRYSRRFAKSLHKLAPYVSVLAQSLLTGRANAAGPPQPNSVRLKCRQ